MRHLRFSVSTLATLFLLNCGSVADSSMNDKKQTNSAPDPKEKTWTLAVKQCNGLDVAILPGEKYVLNDNQLIRILQASKTDSSMCQISYTYYRMISSAGFSGYYTESSRLVPYGATKECQALQNGLATDTKSTTEAASIGPEVLEATLSIRPAKIIIDLTKSQDCPAGSLHLEINQSGT